MENGRNHGWRPTDQRPTHLPSKKTAAKVAGAVGITGALLLSEDYLTTQLHANISSVASRIQGLVSPSSQPSIEASAFPKNRLFVPLLVNRENADTRVFPPHILSKRQDSTGKLETYNTKTGKKEDLIGNNYIKLAWVPGFHANFVDGIYNKAEALADLHKMAQDKYNFVRVFINDAQIGDSKGGLSESYMDNLADFIKMARDNNIYVFLTINLPPVDGGYRIGVKPDDTINVLFLTKGGDLAQEKYLTDLTTKLGEYGVTDNIIYSLINEAFFDKRALRDGSIVVFNGKSYGMPQDLNDLMADSLIDYINRSAKAIRKIDPTALIAFGSFNKDAVDYPDRFEVVATARVMREAKELDIYDAHMYYTEEISPDEAFKREAASFQETTIDKLVPFDVFAPNVLVQMNEFGIFVPGRTPLNIDNTKDVAKALQRWVIMADCYGIESRALWHWKDIDDPTGQYVDDIYTGIKDGDDTIEKALAPGNNLKCPPENKPSSKVIYPQGFESRNSAFLPESKKPEPWQKNNYLSLSNA